MALFYVFGSDCPRIKIELLISNTKCPYNTKKISLASSFTRLSSIT